jgi:hypothetical protein
MQSSAAQESTGTANCVATANADADNYPAAISTQVIERRSSSQTRLRTSHHPGLVPLTHPRP